MAFNSHSLFTLFIITLILILTPSTFARPDVPSDSNRKHPESFVSYDGTVLVPGLGRVVVPKFRKGKFKFNPFTYNPVTGTGGGFPGTGTGGATGTGRTPSYVPGGDDTFVPNPGYEVPIPSGGIPTPKRG